MICVGMLKVCVDVVFCMVILVRLLVEGLGFIV